MCHEIDQNRRSLFKRIRSRKLALAVTFFANLSPVPAWSQPYSVTGVKTDDVLNMRADVDHTLDVGSSEIIGAIPHDASDVMVTGVSVDIGETKWREIEYKGTVGWVNDRYLRPTDLMLETPEALQCEGMEPFWTVMIDENGRSSVSANLEDPVELEYLSFEPGIGRTDLWAHYLGNVDADHSLTVIVRYTETCVDGMSGLTYDFEALLLGLDGSPAPAHGCCSIMLR
jgi:uncharacterized membrane protein